MTSGQPDGGSHARGNARQPHAPQVGLGAALLRAWLGYQLRLDEALAAAGFEDRSFPDGRVLRICAANPAGTTISHIGRELGITRQGAGKAVASLRERRYVTVTPSDTSGREKVVTLAPRAVDYLAAQRTARRTIERQISAELGPQAYAAVNQLLEALGAEEDVRLGGHLRKLTNASSLRYPDDWLPPTDSARREQTPRPPRQPRSQPSPRRSDTEHRLDDPM